jgi:hypothetical protein
MKERKSNLMLRVFALFGMASGFLVISPSLRGTVAGGLVQAAAGMDKYSPYSYAGAGLALLGVLMLAFLKGSAAR